MTELLGIIGTLLLVSSGIPTAYRTYKAGKSIGTPISIAWMVVLGLKFMFAYLYFQYGFNLLIAGSYLIQILSWEVIIYYHYKGLNYGTN